MSLRYEFQSILIHSGARLTTPGLGLIQKSSLAEIEPRTSSSSSHGANLWTTQDVELIYRGIVGVVYVKKPGLETDMPEPLPKMVTWTLLPVTNCPQGARWQGSLSQMANPLVGPLICIQSTALHCLRQTHYRKVRFLNVTY